MYLSSILPCILDEALLWCRFIVKERDASAPTPAAELRLQAELGRRAVNISKEIFEAAGVPVPPGYTKVGTGDLRRVFKQIAR